MIMLLRCCYYDAATMALVMAVYTTLLDWRGNQPHEKMCCLSCTTVDAAATMMLLRCCYYDAATTTLLLRCCYYDAATTTLLLRRCYYACSAAAILGSEQVLPWNLLQAVIAAIAVYAIAVYAIAVYTIAMDIEENMYAKEKEQERRRGRKRRKSHATIIR